VILGSENCEGFTDTGEKSMAERKGKQTKGKMKRNPCQRLQTPAGILNFPWSGERNESEVITSVIWSVYGLKYEMTNSMQFWSFLSNSIRAEPARRDRTSRRVKSKTNQTN
jgi:hypothetical protein